MFSKKNTIEQLAHKLAEMEDKVCQEKAANMDLSQLNKVIKYCEEKAIPLYNKSFQSIEQTFSKGLFLESDEKSKELLITIAQKDNLDCLLDASLWRSSTVSYDMHKINQDQKCKNALINLAKGYHEAMILKENLLHLLSLIKPIAEERNDRKASSCCFKI